MIPTCDMQSILTSLREAFSERYDDRENGHIRLTGILIAPAASMLAKSQIVPRLIDFHHRSDNNIDFFVAGYGAGKIDSVSKEIPNTSWTYNSESANKLINELELSTTWEYSGGCDLILLNAKYKESNKHVALDYGTAVVLQLETMIEQKAISDIAMFFEEIFRYAKTCSGRDPCWGFSDKIGVKKGLPAILHMVSNAIPGKPFDEIQRLKNFAIRDISRA